DDGHAGEKRLSKNHSERLGFDVRLRQQVSASQQIAHVLPFTQQPHTRFKTEPTNLRFDLREVRSFVRALRPAGDPEYPGARDEPAQRENQVQVPLPWLQAAGCQNNDVFGLRTDGGTRSHARVSSRSG